MNTMKYYLRILVITLSISLFSNALIAQNNKYKDKKNWDKEDKKWGSSIGGWEKIGNKTVQKITESDEFRPTSRRTYSAIKIRVKNNPVTINKMTIYYDNGQSQEVVLRKFIGPGEETRIINLIGNKRRIDKIRFLYKSKNLLGSRAEVEVWAKRN
ncbi:hypothetical protein [Flavobacterium sp. IMCC34518]|uniref:hypothetical protein n=1 Tax=Flavobacterium sp. IMCC34518 TaxID=3003623 RepID=UPI00248310BE|nr:hypothetical protein [Flavobacterium sp. IMCC34518]